ncbi:hypothetical protein ACFE04_021475 [Oxalis oulophora]
MAPSLEIVILDVFTLNIHQLVDFCSKLKKLYYIDCTEADILDLDCVDLLKKCPSLRFVAYEDEIFCMNPFTKKISLKPLGDFDIHSKCSNSAVFLELNESSFFEDSNFPRIVGIKCNYCSIQVSWSDPRVFIRQEHVTVAEHELKMKKSDVFSDVKSDIETKRVFKNSQFCKREFDFRTINEIAHYLDQQRNRVTVTSDLILQSSGESAFTTMLVHRETYVPSPSRIWSEMREILWRKCFYDVYTFFKRLKKVRL